jgi:hypothetical protein
MFIVQATAVAICRGQNCKQLFSMILIIRKIPPQLELGKM